ncbi:5860_t:CDS:2 [Diversispora eburnea]|uniref:ubiquitinyl hydrolase 1 n=1 Tax=Diversispora eburnea TaxID=1213867 RepID=A0A9N8V7Z4_9GLOM|nr:5860_t:CDS:2 [Diversispora eburnea]
MGGGEIVQQIDQTNQTNNIDGVPPVETSPSTTTYENVQLSTAASENVQLNTVVGENVEATSPSTEVAENVQPTSPSTVTEASPSAVTSENFQPTTPSTVTGENVPEVISESSEGEGLKQEPIDTNASNESTIKVEESSQTEPVVSSNDSRTHPPEGGFSETSSIPKEYQATFEQNAEYCEAIRKEAAEKSPLVCLPEPIDKLYEEYMNGSEVFRQKIMKLTENHRRIRRCRGDGNSFGFAWFEQLMVCKNKVQDQAAINSLASTKPLLDSVGYQKYVYEDFYDVFEGHLKSIGEGRHDDDTLLSIFQTDEISNQIVLYLRFITAAYLKKYRDEYEPFLDFDFGMDDFCSKFVEVMDQEADHIHVIALTKALKVPVEVAYMSGSSSMDQVNFHEFYPEETEKGVNSPKPLVLLYRPGHYDILYRND